MRGVLAVGGTVFVVVVVLAAVPPARADIPSRLVLVDLATGKHRPLVRERYTPRLLSLRWSADGTSATYVRDARDVTLVRLDVASGQRIRLERLPRADVAALSPAADQVAFDTFSFKRSSVIVRRLSGERVLRWRTPARRIVDGIAWSEDGALLAVTTFDRDFVSYLTVLDATTGEPLRTRSQSRSFKLSGHPFSGRRIAYVKGGERLNALDVDTGAITHLGREVGLEFPAWSPAGAVAAIDDDVLDVFPDRTRVRFSGGGVTDFLTAFAWLAEDRIAIGYGSIAGGRAALGIAGRRGTAKRLTGLGHGIVNAITPSPDGTRALVALGDFLPE
jgi:hypothetical protein